MDQPQTEPTWPETDEELAAALGAGTGAERALVWWALLERGLRPLRCDVVAGQAALPLGGEA